MTSCRESRHGELSGVHHLRPTLYDRATESCARALLGGRRRIGSSGEYKGCGVVEAMVRPGTESLGWSMWPAGLKRMRPEGLNLMAAGGP